MRAALLSALAIVSACAHAGTSAESTDRRSSEASARAQLHATKVQLVQYLRARDDSGLARLMTQDAILDLPAGAVLWSPGAILETLGTLGNVSIEDVSFTPRVSQLCVGAAWEAGEYSARLRPRDSTAARIQSGGYKLEWSAAPDGSLRVKHIIMLDRLTRSALRSTPC